MFRLKKCNYKINKNIFIKSLGFDGGRHKNHLLLSFWEV